MPPVAPLVSSNPVPAKLDLANDKDNAPAEETAEQEESDEFEEEEQAVDAVTEIEDSFVAETQSADGSYVADSMDATQTGGPA